MAETKKTNTTLSVNHNRAVHDEAEAIYTGELTSHFGIEGHNTVYETFNHSMEQWAIGDIHTNSIEGLGVQAVYRRCIP